jgi:periplasmic protein TonB
MAKYRGLFLLISVVMWAGILYAVSKVKPTLISDIFGEEKVIKADKDKKPPPPPPPPPPPEKLPPPPPLLERKTIAVVDVPRPPEPPRQVDVKPPPPPPKLTDFVDTRTPEVKACPNPAFQQASGGGTIRVQYDPPPGAGSGRVSAELDIDPSGRVTDVSFGNRSGNAQFDSAFESAARAGRYEPALRECNPVAGKVSVNASFTAAEIPKPPEPTCREAATAPRKLRAFNIERAYPARAVERGTEGSVTATLQISDAGDVVGVVVTQESPAGVFGSAVEREARRMKYTPARRDCANVADTVTLQVQFKLDGE